MSNEIIKINVSEIIPNTYQPRKYFKEDALAELAESIKVHGIIQPITVRRRGKIYELVAGERRFRAAQLAGLLEVPCTIIQITDCESAEIALLENLQREDLNFIEEAEAYYNLIKDHNFTQEQLAKRMGKKQSTIANKLRLLRLNSEIREVCVDNNLTERHARALLSVDNLTLQKKILKKIIKDKLNVRQTEELINREMLKIAGKELEGKKKAKIKSAFPAKLYVNSIKQVFDKFNIPAKYDLDEKDEYIEIKIKIPKTKK